ncbi:MAG: NAD-dependent epimerase/dehydratase family protein [Prevotella sp.]|jgi:nucleoside-diphosphate-sugar epimerase|nr:NAD-dependent epimerase/dehydratase family protein [Prevotella sp.]
MKLLLVGGTGVLSTAITQEALKKNIEVYMINRGHRMDLIPRTVRLLKANIRDKKRIHSLLDGLYFDAIIDFICYTERDVEYSFNLFKNCSDQYVFISSCAVYSGEDGGVCTEDSPKVIPIWEYSVNKNKCEELLMKLSNTSKANYTIVRPAVTYGDTRIPYGITPPYGYHWTIVERILNKKPIITWNNGKNGSNMLHADDFAVGLVGLLGNRQAYNEAFNIAGDEAPSWEDVLHILSDILGVEVKTFDIPNNYYAREIPSREGEILGGRSGNGTISSQKIKAVVKNFQQTITLKDGITRTLNYYKNHNYIYGIDYAFDADTDRIIAKYAKENHILTKDLNLRFIDYRKTGKKKDQVDYFIYKQKDFFAIKSYLFIKQLIRRIIRKAMRLLTPGGRAAGRRGHGRGGERKEEEWYV